MVEIESSAGVVAKFEVVIVVVAVDVREFVELFVVVFDAIFVVLAAIGAGITLGEVRCCFLNSGMVAPALVVNL